jgi:hypothetical protein
MGKSYKEKRTKLIIEGELPRKPKKPRVNGSGFHKDGRKVRLNTRNDQLKNSLEEED